MVAFTSSGSLMLVKAASLFILSIIVVIVDSAFPSFFNCHAKFNMFVSCIFSVDCVFR